MKSISYSEYNSHCATISEQKAKTYKIRVDEENRNCDYTKFAVNKVECDTVIHQNIENGFAFCGDTRKEGIVPNSDDILDVQLNLIEKE